MHANKSRIISPFSEGQRTLPPLEGSRQIALFIALCSDNSRTTSPFFDRQLSVGN